MKTGASVSPSLFVQPGASARAATRRIEIQAIFFMFSPSSLPEDPGSNEDQQLIVLLGPRLVAEEVTQDRDLPETRDHVVLVLIVDLKDTADDARAPVAHEDVPPELADRQGYVLAVRQVQSTRRLPLRDVDGQQNRSLVGD